MAGLAAYFLSLDNLAARLQVKGEVARRMKEFLKKNARPISCKPDAPIVLWNLQDGLMTTSPQAKVKKRQVACPVSSSSVSSVSTRPPATSTTPSIPAATIRCTQPRNDKAPSLDKIHSMISDNGIFARECSTKFPGTQKSLTFNSDFYFTTLKTTGDFPLRFCLSGLNEILSNCINARGFYGGVYQQGDELYNISDSV